MDYKKKLKIEQTILMVLSLAGFAGVGASVGAFLGTLQKNMDQKMSRPVLLLVAVAALLGIFLAYYINICLHEVGHMIFGRLSGYHFSSLRFGKLMWVNENGKLRFRKYQMPGTGGQCIMTVPDVDAEHMPVVLYNLGGLLVNLIVFALGVGVFFGLRSSHPVAGQIALVFALIALIIIITNGLPLSQLGTDGANTVLLCRDVNARVAFKKQLDMIKYLSENISISEMPETVWAFDRSVPMTNPLTTSQAIVHFNYLSAVKRYDEAKEMAYFILENAKSINQLHEKILHGEILFMTMVVDRDMAAAKEQYAVYGKEMERVASFISMQRVLYAYYTLAEPDEKKAAKYAKLFANSVRTYPYPKDAAMEQEQFDMVAQAAE